MGRSLSYKTKSKLNPSIKLQIKISIIWINWSSTSTKELQKQELKLFTPLPLVTWKAWMMSIWTITRNMNGPLKMTISFPMHPVNIPIGPGFSPLDLHWNTWRGSIIIYCKQLNRSKLWYRYVFYNHSSNFCPLLISI